jgi:hypothetical protein
LAGSLVIPGRQPNHPRTANLYLLLPLQRQADAEEKKDDVVEGSPRTQRRQEAGLGGSCNTLGFINSNHLNNEVKV